MLGWHEFKKWILYSLRQCKLSYVIVLSNSINIGLVSNNSMLRCKGVFCIPYNNFS